LISFFTSFSDVSSSEVVLVHVFASVCPVCDFGVTFVSSSLEAKRDPTPMTRVSQSPKMIFDHVFTGSEHMDNSQKSNSFSANFR
jgi:thiol-disulfide isomerase/thioredoxin